MEPRIDLYAPAHAGALKAMLGLESYVRRSGIEPSLLHLIKTRASQINGCAYCIDMHTKDARAEGETEQRLYALDACRETPFSARERAALEWTESVTLVSQTHVPDETHTSVRQQFDEEELANPTMASVVINGWNRIAIAFRSTPGTYEPPTRNREHTTA